MNMKKNLYILVFLILCFINGQAQQLALNKIVGRWEFMGEQGSGGALEIIDSSTLFLTYMGERRRIDSLRIDHTRTPVWFDFTTQDTATSVNIKSLMQIVNDSLIKWQLFVDEPRTNYFTANRGEIFYLRKARQTPAVISSAKQ
jgi:hypothetical protein